MNFDPGQIDTVLNAIQYPVTTNSLIQQAHAQGVNDQFLGMLQRVLPDKTFNSPEELKSAVTSMMGNFGNLGNMGGTVNP